MPGKYSLRTTATACAALVAASAAVLSSSATAPVANGRTTVTQAAADTARTKATATPQKNAPGRATVNRAPKKRAPGTRAPVAPAQTRPNVVMITADDMSIADLEYMPFTQKLMVDQGTTFTQAISTNPICVPARASFLTGQYSHNHGALSVTGPYGGFDNFDDRRTLPTWLRSAGYDTAFIGKYLNGYGQKNPRYIPPGWTQWRGTVDMSTYSFFNTKFNINGRVVKPLGYSSDLIAAQTSAALTEQAKRPNKPFFLWANYVAPHHGGPTEPDDPSRIYTDGPASQMHSTTPAPRDRNTFDHLNLPDVPEMWADSGSQFSRDPATPEYRTGMREVYQQRIEALQAVDRSVGKTIATLEKTGDLDNTLVIVNSDNGYLTGHHNREGKLAPFDRVLRIPMIMRGPGIARGKSVSTPITPGDVAVSIARLARATPTRDVDGINVLARIGSNPNARRVIPVEGYLVGGGPEPLYTGIRYGAWTYVRIPGKPDELYNRNNDPGELVDLAGEPSAAPMLDIMRRLDGRYRSCAGVSCPGSLNPDLEALVRGFPLPPVNKPTPSDPLRPSLP